MAAADGHEATPKEWPWNFHCEGFDGPVLPSPTTPDALCSLGYQLKRVAKYREVYGVDLHGHGKLVKDYVGAAARAHADDYDSWGGILKKILENVERAAVKQQAKAKFIFEKKHHRCVEM